MKRFILLILTLFIVPFSLIAQDEKENYNEVNPLIKTTSSIERSAFESAALIDNQTDLLNQKATLEFIMNHRFGLINNDATDFDLLGIYGVANIRLSLNYAITDWVSVGYGTTKDSRLQDFNYKIALLKQTKDNKFPVSVSFYGNTTANARDRQNFNNVQDRYSFFNQIIIARKFSRKFSALVTPSVSHFNLVENGLNNDVFALGVGARYKVTPQMAITAEYTEPFDDTRNTESGASVGVEFVTGSHAFQIFATNYRSIVQQHNIVTNSNDFFSGDIAIGFNITRLWNF